MYMVSSPLWCHLGYPRKHHSGSCWLGQEDGDEEGQQWRVNHWQSARPLDVPWASYLITTLMMPLVLCKPPTERSENPESRELLPRASSKRVGRLGFLVHPGWWWTSSCCLRAVPSGKAQGPECLCHLPRKVPDFLACLRVLPYNKPCSLRQSKHHLS